MKAFCTFQAASCLQFHYCRTGLGSESLDLGLKFILFIFYPLFENASVIFNIKILDVFFLIKRTWKTSQYGVKISLQRTCLSR